MEVKRAFLPYFAVYLDPDTPGILSIWMPDLAHRMQRSTGRRLVKALPHIPGTPHFLRLVLDVPAGQVDANAVSPYMFKRIGY